MGSDFTMSDDQQTFQVMDPAFARQVLAPDLPTANEPDLLQALAMTYPASIKPYKAGSAMAMLSKEYGGGGILIDENVDPRAVRKDNYIGFEKSIEGIGTVAAWDRQYSNSGATLDMAAE